MLSEYVVIAPSTPVVKSGSGIHPIALDDMQLSFGVSAGGEAILHAVNRLIEDRGDDAGLSMLLVDFKNSFNLVDRRGNTSYSRAKKCSRVIPLDLCFLP
nr:hypothetical protein [Tanacetum cinerariifolium]